MQHFPRQPTLYRLPRTARFFLEDLREVRRLVEFRILAASSLFDPTTLLAGFSMMNT